MNIAYGGGEETAGKVSFKRHRKKPLSTNVAAPGETDKIIVPRETRKAAKVPPMPMGCGGRQHRYIQELVKGLAEEQGYRAIIEELVLGGEGFVDVSLARGDEKIGLRDIDHYAC